ncbi:deoxyribodipyrimidine photolyase [Actinomycetospora endophytica]|uniref:Deoxyribodipyrimidine photolyase n=1 Tax=Actinomycetospora endophytica TaxID=2291215 RepID=A0ABS8PJ88_9PSEU|nr:FAD-binding domain-containing protein [Actinomycetospora endophytica]MCD2197471.1 deoxyribodipyrimidine photolyase [Actinomycetospora endophytica]
MDHEGRRGNREGPLGAGGVRPDVRLPVPDPGPDAAVAFVGEHLADLACDTPAASPSFRGGQTAADAALAALDVTHYARRRNEVWPPERRGASRMSPWIRHGLLSLPALWEHVADAAPRDRTKYRDELAWQEYARHVYARVGTRLRDDLRAHPPRPPELWDDPWPRDMACMDTTVSELHDDGWLVNQTRMWLASQWTVRAGARWRDGEDAFFTHLLDGSRAANRLGWQWTVGSGTGKAYGFSRYQVEKRAPKLCAGCALNQACPVQDWPPEQRTERIEPPSLLRSDPDPEATAGPSSSPAAEVDAVWLTAESLGDDDPALAAHSDVPAVFVFDEPLLRRLRLSGKRLVFLAETLADLATRRPVELYRGRVPDELGERRLAVTFAPVPGFRRLSTQLQPNAVHPWPWLFRPNAGRLQSYTAWRKGMPA